MLEKMNTPLGRAMRAASALRFITDPPLSDDMKELAYKQITDQLHRLADIEYDLKRNNIHVLNSGQILYNVHDENESCTEGHCAIHNPSAHHMREWPMRMRQDLFARPLIERFCKHGTGHPDPDSAAWLNEHGPEGARGSWGVHGCCGCCSNQQEPILYDEEE